VLGTVSGWLGRRYESLLYGWVRKRRLPLPEYQALVQDEAAYRVQFLTALSAQNLDALICPPFGLPALPHGTFYGAVAGSYALLYNLLGMPAGVVAVTRVRPGEESDRPTSRDPVERTARRVEIGSEGLPIGVQVVAGHWREDIVLALMAALEHEFRSKPDYPARPDI
jgi:fatty acid amide hydrolase